MDSSSGGPGNLSWPTWTLTRGDRCSGGFRYLVLAGPEPQSLLRTGLLFAGGLESFSKAGSPPKFLETAAAGRVNFGAVFDERRSQAVRIGPMSAASSHFSAFTALRCPLSLLRSSGSASLVPGAPLNTAFRGISNVG